METGMTSVPGTTIAIYDSPHQFELLLPQKRLDELVAKTRDVFEKAHELRGASCPPAREALRELVREMTSYYSNRIALNILFPNLYPEAAAANIDSVAG
ncbi:MULTISPECIES: hypothetical protein [Cupriavidus]